MIKYKIFFAIICIYNIFRDGGKWALAIIEREHDEWFWVGRVSASVVAILTIVVIANLLKKVKK